MNKETLRQNLPAIIAIALPVLLVLVIALLTALPNLGPKPQYDFLFVKDTASGFLNVGTHEKSVGQVLNLGTGKDVSIGQLLELCIQLTGAEQQHQIDEARIRPKNSEVMHLLCNANRSFELTGWRPKHSLEEGLLQVIEFIKTEARLYNTAVYNV